MFYLPRFVASLSFLSLFVLTRCVNAYGIESYTFSPSIVKESALATDVEKIPGNASVLNARQIQNMPNTKIADTLKKLAGVRVDNDTSFNPRPKIKIRGINYGTLLMLDGVILSDLEGESRILNQISLYDVERVEVARGAFSSLYGAGAIGGVVNFITAMPSEFSSQIIISYGDEFVKDTADKNLIRAYANVGDVFFDKKLRLKLSAGYTQSEGYPSFPTTLPSGIQAPNDISGITTDKAGNLIIGDGGKRNYHVYDVRLKAEYGINDSHMLSAMLSFSNHSYKFKHFTSYITDNAGQSTNLVDGKDYFVGSGIGGIGNYSHLLGNLTYEHDFDSSSLKLSFSSMNLFSLWQDATQGEGNRYGGAGGTQDIDSTSNYIDIIYTMNLGSRHTLISAAQFRYYDFVQHNRNMTNWKVSSTRTDTYRSYGGKAFVASAFMNLHSSLSQSLSSSLGIRYDYWRNYAGYLTNTLNPTTNRHNQGAIASILSPKLSLNYTPESTQGLIFKTSLGSGFRMPTMRDMYQFTHGNTFWEINPDLKQESALSFDIGAEYYNKSFEGKLYYYDTELWDMIYRSGAGNQNNPYKNINAGRGRIHGAELSAQVPIMRDVFIEGNYTLTLAKILKNDAKPNTEGKQLAATPKHMANIALNYFPQYGFYGSIWAYYAPAFFADDMNTPALKNTYGNYEAQFTLNAKCGYNFKNGIDLSASFANITNNRYYDFYRVAGASYALQLRYKI